MSLKVMGWRLLVKPIEVVESLNKDVPEFLKDAGFQVSVGDEKTKLMYEAGVERGTVVEVGSRAFKSVECGWGENDWQPWCKVGDEVTFVKYAGRPQVDPDTGEEFLILNDVDILARVEKN